MIRKFFLIPYILFITNGLFAQSGVEELHSQATTLMQHSQYDEAIKTLDEALKQQPDDLSLLKDKMYANFLKRDYSSAVSIGKKLTERDDVDEQTYQILGFTYKAIADYKTADKMYRSALEKFPKSAVLYSEYGDMLYQSDNKKNAILSWEKGIQSNSNYSGNYYYAAKYYAENDNLVWSLLYGEIFVNLESLSQRTVEIKKLLLQDYQKLFKNAEPAYTLSMKSSGFEKAVATAMTDALNNFINDGTPYSITSFRTRFLLNWYNNYNKKYPYHLFAIQHQFLENGTFDAYNQWLFTSVINKDRYDNWATLHDGEMKDFLQYQRNALFKVPPENYYAHD